jgi:hypothetical protein
LTMTQVTGIRRELEAAPAGAAGASLRQTVDWCSINWKRANRHVRRLQRRIVQAQQQGRKRKVRALQFTIARADGSRGKLLLGRRVPTRGRLKCLSRVPGNQHARFLGEAMAVMPSPYPVARIIRENPSHPSKSVVAPVPILLGSISAAS